MTFVKRQLQQNLESAARLALQGGMPPDDVREAIYGALATVEGFEHKKDGHALACVPQSVLDWQYGQQTPRLRNVNGRPLSQG